MTNTIFFYQADRDYWSESTSQSETPRPSSAEDEPVPKALASSSTVVGAAQVQPNPVKELKTFNFNELKTATNNFHRNNFLGEDDFGRFYKGWVDEKKLIPSKPGRGLAVAVKICSPESMQNPTEWLTELRYLEKLFHPNIVRLFGYCCDEEELLLVHEFMPRGSFENHLFRRGSSNSLSWNLRMKVALGAAKGLAFVHSANVIYRDFKTSNILLDSVRYVEDYNAKLSGFALARDGPRDSIDTHVSTRVMGTYGYVAPEYLVTGHLHSTNDVYGFGVVLLEILSGQRAIDSKRPSGERDLVKWAKPCLMHKHEKFRILDHHLEGQFSPRAFQRAAYLVLRCIDKFPKSRPTMDEVVTMLEQLIQDK